MKKYNKFIVEASATRAKQLLNYYRDILINLGFSMDRVPNLPDNKGPLNPDEIASGQWNHFTITGSTPWNKRKFIELSAREDRRGNTEIYIGQPDSFRVPLSDDSDLIRYLERTYRQFRS